MNRFLFCVLFLLVSLLAGSCAKEGCTDESAANYNITADKDDGTCLYCTDSFEEILQSTSLNVIDFRSSSTYVGQIVLKINLQVKLNSFPLRNCGSSGCFLIITATNNTNSVMTNILYDISVSIMNQGSFGFIFSTPQQLNPGESFTYSEVSLPLEFSGCPSLSPNQSTGAIWSANYN